MRSIKDEDFNKNFNLLREEFRKDALKSDIYPKSKEKVKEVLGILLSPLLSDGYIFCEIFCLLALISGFLGKNIAAYYICSILDVQAAPNEHSKAI